VDQCVVLPFNARLAAQSPKLHRRTVLVRGLGVRYVLVGDDFRFGARARATTPCWTPRARPRALTWRA
jgi:FAD synthase